MSCSAAEIAEKKRQAIERLKQTKSQLVLHPNAQIQTKKPPSNSIPVTSPGTTSKTTSTFYGNSTAQKANELAKYESKVKNSTEHHASNRILSQPYPSKTGSTTTATATPASSNSNKQVSFLTSSSVSCTCALVSENRFQITITGFHSKLVEVFKSVPSSRYDQETKTWSFDFGDYDLVHERVGLLKPDVVIGALPKFVLNLLRSDKREIDFSCIEAIEKKLSSQLLDFQKYGVAFGISNSGRCMIADDMGLGKTYQAIAIADFYKDDWPLLIVTTATAREGWERHIRDLLPWVPSQSIGCLLSTQDHIGDIKVLVTSYALMDKNCDRLLQKKFGFIILDESHSIKNFKSKSTKSATRLSEKAKRIVLLSGTPALSRPAELFCQLYLIDKHFFGSFKEYSFRYCAGKNTTFGLDSSGQSNLKELNVVLKRRFLVRRTKEDVQFELGEKSRETILLDPSKIWNSRSDKLREAIENCKDFSTDIMKLKGYQREEVLLRLYAETAILKADAVCSHIKDLVRKKLKFIVFAHHVVMLNALSQCLNKLAVDYIRIDGTTKNDLRNTYIDRFQREKSCQVAVLSLKACNAAITLTAASLVVFSELDWNPSTMAQCESRAHRIGQKSPVTCQYLLASGTADDYIWEMLKKKQDVLNKAGIFSEDLSDATHSAAPIAESSKMTAYFDAVQPSTSKGGDKDAVNENNNVLKMDVDEPMETDDYKHMLDDDDEDAAFLELDF